MLDFRLPVNSRVSLPGQTQRSGYQTNRGLGDLVESRGGEPHRYREIYPPAERGDREGEDGRESRTGIGHGCGVVQSADGRCSETRGGLRLKPCTELIAAPGVPPHLDSGVDHVLDLGKFPGLGKQRMITENLCQAPVA